MKITRTRPAHSKTTSDRCPAHDPHMKMKMDEENKITRAWPAHEENYPHMTHTWRKLPAHDPHMKITRRRPTHLNFHLINDPHMTRTWKSPWHDPHINKQTTSDRWPTHDPHMKSTHRGRLYALIALAVASDAVCPVAFEIRIHQVWASMLKTMTVFKKIQDASFVGQDQTFWQPPLADL